MIKKKVPELKKKPRHDAVDPDSLTAALNWDTLADPGDGRKQTPEELLVNLRRALADNAEKPDGER